MALILSNSTRLFFISASGMRSTFWKSSFQSELADQRCGDWIVVRGAGAVSNILKASSSVAVWESRSSGLPAELPSGKSLKTNRGTPQCSTISLALPRITVGIPWASRYLAVRLTVWWQTGQLAVRIARSTSSSVSRASISAQSCSIVVTWLLLVGMP